MGRDVILLAHHSISQCIIGAQELFIKGDAKGLYPLRGQEGNDSQGLLTTGLKHSDFVHLRLGHVEHQLVLSEEIPGGLGSQGHQGHVLQVWNGKV